MENLVKMDDLGVPLFLETPIWVQSVEEISKPQAWLPEATGRTVGPGLFSCDILESEYIDIQDSYHVWGSVYFGRILKFHILSTPEMFLLILAALVSESK